MRKIFTLLLVSMVLTSFAQRDVMVTKKFQMPDLSKSSKTYLVPGNWENATDAVTYVWTDAGNIFGVNSYGDLAYGQIFQITETYQIGGGLFWIGAKTGTEGEVVFTIWDYSTGEVGDILASKTIAFADVTASENFEDAFSVTFDEPVTVEGDFIMGVDISGLNAWEEGVYEFGNVSSASGDGAGAGLALVQETGGWIAVLDYEVDVDIAIFPVLAEEAETVDVTFNVDMTGVEGFDPETNSVYLTGSFTDWATPGEEGSIEMTEVTSKEYTEVFKEDFETYEDGAGTIGEWLSYDQDGDTYNWFIFATQDYTKVATSASYVKVDETPTPLTPENWLVSPAIDLSSYSGGEVLLDWTVFAQDPDWVEEHYKVLISTTAATVESFLEENNVFEETLPGSDIYNRSVDLSSYAGQTIYIAFVHYDCTDWFRINLDDVVVKATSGSAEELIYTATVAIEPGEIQYKYFSDAFGTGLDGGEWDGENYRIVTISEATTLNDVWGDEPQDVDTETLNNATSIYPNPVSDVLTVSHNSRISGISVFDVTGRMMYNAEVSNLNTTTVDVSRFNEGVYILQVVTNEGIANKKFVVK